MKALIALIATIGILILATIPLVECSRPTPVTVNINPPTDRPLTDAEKAAQQEARARFNVSARGCKELSEPSRGECLESALNAYDGALHRIGIR